MPSQNAENPSSIYGRTARPLIAGIGKTFIVYPAASTLGPAVQAEFPSPDADGVVRAFADTTGDGFAAAIAQMVTGRGDQLFVLPGTYTISTAITTTSVDDIHIQGLGTIGSVILNGSAANILAPTTCKGWEITNLQLNLASTKKCLAMVGCNGFNIHDNLFLSAVGGSASHFIHMLTTACNYNKVINNIFISNFDVSGGAITQTSHVTGLGIGNTIAGNKFVAGRITTANAGAVTNGVVFANVSDAGNFVYENEYIEFNGATFTAGINYGTTALAGSVMATFNNLMLATAANAIVNGANAGEFANNIVSGTV